MSYRSSSAAFRLRVEVQHFDISSGVRLFSRAACLAALMILAVFGASSFAHESRPAYLEIHETAPGRYELLWRTPLNAGVRLPLALKLPEAVRNVTEPSTRELP